MSKLLLPDEAGQLLRLTGREVTKAAQRGEIPHVVLPGDEIRFIEDELWRWLRDRQQSREEVPA